MGSTEERWSVQSIESMQGTPWGPVPGKVDDSIHVRVRLPEEGEAPQPVNPGEPNIEIKRRARITREDVIKVGFSLNCPGCTAISRKASSQNHTEACRERIEKALIEQGGVKAKLIAEGRERDDEHIAKRKQPVADDNQTKDDGEPDAAQQGSKIRKKRQPIGSKRERDENDQQDKSGDQPPSKFQGIEGEDDDNLDPASASAVNSLVNAEEFRLNRSELDSVV